jgi:drug/metabolite transporter (DMT)-like permease
MVVSVFSWGLFSVFSRKALQKTSPGLGMLYALSFGWLYASIPFLFSGGIGEIAGISATGWGNILLLGVFCSALAYLFWYDALKELQASEVGVFLYVNPVVAVLISALFLGESISVSMVAGGILVFLGVWFVNSGKK